MEIIACIVIGAIGGIVMNILMGNGRDIAAMFGIKLTHEPKKQQSEWLQKQQVKLDKSPVYRIYED